MFVSRFAGRRAVEMASGVLYDKVVGTGAGRAVWPQTAGSEAEDSRQPDSQYIEADW